MSKILFISNISNRITTFVTASIVAAHSLNMDFYQAANWQDADPSQIATDEKAYDIVSRFQEIRLQRQILRHTKSLSHLSNKKILITYIATLRQAEF